jgi:hypothetical protein
MKQKSSAIIRRLGPVGTSLVAAAITAAGFAAISVAANDDKRGSGDGAETFRVGPPPGPGASFRDELSEEDRQAMEDFRQCMSDQGAEPPKFDPDNPPEPPSAEEREKIEKAFEACREKLPEGMREGPSLHVGPGCPPGPPPGAERSKNGDGQDDSENQGYILPAPQGSST